MRSRRRVRRESSSLKRTVRGVVKRNKKLVILLSTIGSACLIVLVWFGTSALSDPDFELDVAMGVTPPTKKVVSVNAEVVIDTMETTDETKEQEDTGTTLPAQTTYGNWTNLCGRYWGDYPLELYVLSTMCERGCSEAAILKCSGDRGRAYGLMQLDYRYDLVPFMKEAYRSNPEAWAGFAEFQGCSPGDAVLVGNQKIIDGFNFCYKNYPQTYMEMQPNFFVEKYLYNPVVLKYMENNNFKMEEHSIFVAAAIMSCNINCGYETGISNFFKAGARNDMSDEELLDCVYSGWRMYRSAEKWRYHNARLATDGSGEQGVALQLLHGEIEVTTFNNSKTCKFGAGWDGPNAVRISRGK